MKLLIPLLLLGLGATVQAADPTRPPKAWLDALQGSESGVAVDSVRLQSILLPKQGRPLAIIGGSTVRLGERYGEDTLVQIRETDVVLRGAGGMTRLYLTPQVNKRMTTTGSGKTGKKKDAP